MQVSKNTSTVAFSLICPIRIYTVYTHQYGYKKENCDIREQKKRKKEQTYQTQGGVRRREGSGEGRGEAGKEWWWWWWWWGGGIAGRGACMHNSQGTVPPKNQEPGAGSVAGRRADRSTGLHRDTDRRSAADTRHRFAGVAFCSSDVCASFLKRKKTERKTDALFSL